MVSRRRRRAGVKFLRFLKFFYIFKYPFFFSIQIWIYFFEKKLGNGENLWTKKRKNYLFFLWDSKQFWCCEKVLDSLDSCLLLVIPVRIWVRVVLGFEFFEDCGSFDSNLLLWLLFYEIGAGMVWGLWFKCDSGKIGVHECSYCSSWILVVLIRISWKRKSFWCLWFFLWLSD